MKKANLAVTGALATAVAGFAGAAEARCVVVSDNDLTVETIGVLATEAHRRGMGNQGWARPRSNLNLAHVSKHSVSGATRQCPQKVFDRAAREQENTMGAWSCNGRDAAIVTEQGDRYMLVNGQLYTFEGETQSCPTRGVNSPGVGAPLLG